MFTHRLLLISVFLSLPLTIASCDRPVSLTEPTSTQPMAAGPAADAPQAATLEADAELSVLRPLCSISPADNQDAITAAISSCPRGSTVFFPLNATYHITDKIVVAGRSDLVIDGNGSTFLKTSPAVDGANKPNWQLQADTNLTLKNMVIRGAFAPSGSRYIIPGNQFEHGINVAGGNGITIQDIKAYNVFGEFVTVQTTGGGSDPVARNVRIERLVGEHAARQCIAPIAVIGFWLVDSKLTDCWQNGVDMEMDVPGEKLQDAHILRNSITGTLAAAIVVPAKGNPGDVGNIEIRGNIVTQPPDNCFPPVLITYAPSNPGNATMLQNIVVEDNQLKTQHNGVQYQDVGSGSIRNNRIENMSGNLCAPPAPTPVNLINSPTVIVSGNTWLGYSSDVTPPPPTDSAPAPTPTPAPAPAPAPTPTTTAGQPPSGALDSVATDGTVYGWSYDPDYAYWQNNVELYFDGPAGSGRTPVTVKADVPDSYAGLHGFRYSVPTQYRDGAPHTVYAYGLDLNDATGASRTLLPGAPKSFTLGSPPAPAPTPTAPANQVPSGALDGVATDGTVYGWSYDPDYAYWQNNVELYFDGPAGSGRTPVTVKADVPDSYAGLHGFRYSVPTQYRDGAPHTVYAYGLDLNDATGASRTLLPGAPKSFTLR